MIPLSKLKSKIYESSGILDSFIYQEESVVISKDLKVIVNNEEIDYDLKNLEEARSYARSYIDNKKILENIDKTIPEEKIANLVKKYHNIDRITDTLVESYKELASSNLFSVDPVITEMKQRTSMFAGKLEYKLSDGSIVAISETTQHKLNRLLDNKYEIVDYMRESKHNFMHVIRQLEE